MKLTSAQKQAVETGGTNILVSAGAGSGKTSVLSRRVIHKLMEGASIDTFIILTFTNAAAAEMKQRIKNEIKTHAQLTDQLPKLENAVISTFDAFALRLVRQYHYLLGLPKDIHVADDVFVHHAESDILEETLKPYYEKNDERFAWLLKRTFDRGDATIKNGLRTVLYHLKMHPNPISFIDDYLSMDDDEYINGLQNKLKRVLEQKRTDLCDIVNHVIRHLEDARDPYVLEYVRDIRETYAFVFEADLNRLLRELADFSHPRLPRSIDEDMKDYVKKYGYFLRDAAYRFKEDIQAFNLDDFVKTKADVKEQLPAIRIMLEMARDYITRLDAYKKEHELFEFSDIMNEAIRLLEDQPDIRRMLRDQTEEIMVDEYQDTNDLQNHMLGLLDKGNVFMVGDIKQSIYRFRNANPRYFSKKYKTYGKKQGGITIDLTDNFRSRPAVIDFINQLFADVMDETIGGIDYDDTQKLRYGNKAYEKSEDDSPDPEVLVYDGDADDDLTDGQREGKIIAADIKNKITEDCQIFDLSSKTDRPVRYGDIAILYDRKTMFDDITKTLSAANIPVLKIDDESFIESHEIVFVRQFLDIVLMLHKRTPFSEAQKQSLYGLLRSFVYEESDEKIVSFLLDHVDDERITIDTLSGFSDMYRHLHAIAPEFFNQPLSDVIFDIYTITDLYKAIATLDNPALCEKKLDFLMARAKDMNESSLQSFITYMHDVAEGDSLDIKFTESAAMDDNRVKLMTMHKSKGLEFPVCYYGGLHKKFNYQKNRDFFVIHRDLGFFSKTMADDGFMKNMCHFLLKELDYKAYLSERLRLLYVALTRAKDRMVFLVDDSRRKDGIAIRNDQGKILPELRFHTRDYLAFITMSGCAETFERRARMEFISDDDHRIKKTDDSVKATSFSRFDFESSPITRSGFSKERLSMEGMEEKQALKAGEEMHDQLESLDFKAYLSGDITLEPSMRIIVDGLLDNEALGDLKSATIYKEYEFYYETNEGTKHGFIDFLAVWDEKAVIIDYKAKNIDDPAYILQLKGYKDYLTSILDIPVETYLYSIATRTLRFIDTTEKK